MNIVLCTFVTQLNTPYLTVQLSCKVVNRKSSSVLGSYLLIISLGIEEQPHNFPSYTLLSRLLVCLGSCDLVQKTARPGSDITSFSYFNGETHVSRQYSFGIEPFESGSWRFLPPRQCYIATYLQLTRSSVTSMPQIRSSQQDHIHSKMQINTVINLFA